LPFIFTIVNNCFYYFDCNYYYAGKDESRDKKNDGGGDDHPHNKVLSVFTILAPLQTGQIVFTPLISISPLP
jgi:hypothetical protein